MFYISLRRWRDARQLENAVGRQDVRPGLALRLITGLMEGVLLWEPGFFA